ncbi:TPA: 2-dehydropantoate 2-reductase [Burkholderia territorii]|uniref:2-dehydropantoate 2-reductase n=1 Tax=Burkholderia territorii TaxID=1503055 RepID=UPI0007544D8D|nr:2-dehydropantoate 2-reductase [Burkholderia territorii]KVG55960.1 2-dehydropantoate 2-reductase [Burkholderia territorii]KVT87960.1 2-dehydropantoate 2-reductase [Burkholderia territorii]KWA06864.1 2-dehydropantoate 2-reductase [Burkholderia territorii]TXG06995.1 2-dehydropantoate 2-reductase [Burkholderia territorii]HDR8859202.1 2-dehydropantoate 2-reductase [Burkholderia territorii]
MRILVVGAGAVGGYFGGRLAAAGRDVTFLVREARAAALARDGLQIRSPRGDLTLANVRTLRAGDAAAPFDLVLLSCKAYSLDEAIASFAPFVGPSTLILPMLNGMRHLDVLRDRFGAGQVLGGLCVIAATLDREQRIVHLNDTAGLSFGELAGGESARVRAVADVFGGAGFDATLSDDIVARMWDKWVFLATLAASTSLFRGSVGDILAAPDGRHLLETMLDETSAIAAHNGYRPDPAAVERMRRMVLTPSPLTASMLRDVENRARVEADHVIGDLLARRDPQASDALSLLRIAYNHLKAYEVRVARESAAA